MEITTSEILAEIANILSLEACDEEQLKELLVQFDQMRVVNDLEL